MAYPLRTARLRIEPLTIDDVSAFAAYRRDPDIARWQGWETGYSDDDARRLIAGQPDDDLPGPGDWLQLAIRDRSGSVLYGDVAIRRLADQPDSYEIGVTLASTAQGQGIATEAVTRVLDYLFTEAAAHRVVAFCDARNAPVARLLARVGMRQESSQLEGDYFKGEWTTLDGYAVLAREHPSRRGR